MAVSSRNYDLTENAVEIAKAIEKYTTASSLYQQSQVAVTAAGLALRELVAKAPLGLFVESGGTLYTIANRNGKNYLKCALPSKARALYTEGKRK